MYNWYTVKVKYTKEFRDGTLKRVTEPYLVNAASFTDAEARIYEEVGEGIRGEFLVTSIAKTDFADIFAYDDSETWYKCKIVHTIEDADSGKEKKVNNNILIAANNAKEAYERAEESLKSMMTSYEIPNISLTPLIEIFPLDTERYSDDEYAANHPVEEEEAPRAQVNVAYNASEEE